MVLLRRAAEPLPAESGEEQLQPLDLGIVGGEPRLALVEFGRLPVEVTRQVAIFPNSTRYAAAGRYSSTSERKRDVSMELSFS